MTDKTETNTNTTVSRRDFSKLAGGVAAATDECDLDRIAALRVDVREGNASQSSGCRELTAGLQEFATGSRGGVRGLIHNGYSSVGDDCGGCQIQSW